MALQLLDATEEAELVPWGAKSWLTSSSRWKRKIRERLIEAVDRLVEFQEDIKAPSPQDPIALSKLMAIVLRQDPVFIGHFEERNPANPDWDRFGALLGRAVVQRWTKDRDLSIDDIHESGRWDVDPNYLDSLESLIELAKEEGIRSGEDLASEMPKGSWSTPSSAPSSFVAQIEAELRSALTTHTELAQPADDGDIPLSAQSREIEKAALLDLRMEDLKMVAEERGIPLSKGKDRLADSIVDQGELTREEIAELVLRFSPDEDFERSITTHLLPLRGSPNLAASKLRLDRLAGKYARIRVARWFVFQQAAEATSGQLLIKGSLRGYRTKAVLDTDDYKVNATPQRTSVSGRLRQGSAWAEVDAHNVVDVKDMRVVLNRGAEVPAVAAIEPQLQPMHGPAASWDGRSIWFLDFLSRALEDAAIEIFNFEMAHFERVGATIEDVSQPQIDKVELRGKHIGSHRDSCALITAGRRLLEVILKIRFVPNSNDEFFLPVKISFFSDRATVSTAPARDVPPSITGKLHRRLVEKVRIALDHEVRFEDISSIAAKIDQRASQPLPAKEADLFAPKQSSEEGPAEATSNSAVSN